MEDVSKTVRAECALPQEKKSHTSRRGRKEGSRAKAAVQMDAGGANAWASGEGKTSGMGLYNVRKRLDLLFGSNYRLKIDDTHDDTYEVKLTIPITYD